MSQAIYVGGFSGGRRTAERVQEALGTYYEDVEAYTFAEAMSRLDEIKRAVKNTSVITHSAGMLALKGTSPSEVFAFGAPLPRGRINILGATAAKFGQMHIGIRNMRDAARVARFDIESGLELVTPTPDKGLGHWRHFMNGDISRFDAIEAGTGLQENGSDVNLTYGTRDLYFYPTPLQRQQAQDGGVRLTSVANDVHDSLVLQPDAVLYRHFSTS